MTISSVTQLLEQLFEMPEHTPKAPILAFEDHPGLFKSEHF